MSDITFGRPSMPEDERFFDRLDSARYVFEGQLGSFPGVPVILSTHVPRGTVFVLGQPPAKIVLGQGLVRGVPYVVPGVVERGYVLDDRGVYVTLLDAVTGRLVDVVSGHAVELEVARRWPRSLQEWAARLARRA